MANAAANLGMKVYGYDPFISVNGAWQLSPFVKHVTDLDDIYEKCDYITVHVPLLPSTREMLNKDAFAKMKDGVVILNYAREDVYKRQSYDHYLRGPLPYGPGRFGGDPG